MTKSRRSLLGSLLGLMPAATMLSLVGVRTASAKSADRVLRVYKSPWCGCCGAWVEHMQAAGFAVRVTELENVAPVKDDLGVTPDLRSCHTALIDGYAIEGHVPAREVIRLLRERPAATGLAVPGMPVGSPGMEQSERRDPYQVVLFSASGRMTYAQY